MSDISENTMKTRMEGNGWGIIYNNNKQYRSIRIGTRLNCNCEIYKNTSIKTYFESILKKYNIVTYEIEEIDTIIEFSYQLNLTEEVYNAFRDKLLNKTIEEKELENN